MQIVVDMEGGAYVLRDLLAMIGHRPGDALEISKEGDRLVISSSKTRVEPKLTALA